MMILDSRRLETSEILDEKVCGDETSDSVVCQSDEGTKEERGSGEVANAVEGET